MTLMMEIALRVLFSLAAGLFVTYLALLVIAWRDRRFG